MAPSPCCKQGLCWCGTCAGPHPLQNTSCPRWTFHCVPQFHRHLQLFAWNALGPLVPHSPRRNRPSARPKMSPSGSPVPWSGPRGATCPPLADSGSASLPALQGVSRAGALHRAGTEEALLLPGERHWPRAELHSQAACLPACLGAGGGGASPSAAAGGSLEAGLGRSLVCLLTHASGCAGSGWGEPPEVSLESSPVCPMREGQADQGLPLHSGAVPQREGDFLDKVHVGLVSAADSWGLLLSRYSACLTCRPEGALPSGRTPFLEMGWGE